MRLFRKKESEEKMEGKTEEKTEGKIKQAMAAQGEVLHCYGLFLCRLLSKFVEKGTIPLYNI